MGHVPLSHTSPDFREGHGLMKFLLTASVFGPKSISLDLAFLWRRMASLMAVYSRVQS